MKFPKTPMAFESFMAGRMIRPGKGSFSGPIILISILSLVLGLSVMIVSVVVLTGFKKEIREKVSGFTGHIHITKFNSKNALESPPLYIDSIDIEQIAAIEGVKHIQSFISKAAIIRTEEEIQGVMIKGVGADFDAEFFIHNIQDGSMPDFSAKDKTNDVMISETLANQLKLRVNDPLRIYFVNNESGKIRGRRFKLKGIYHTSVEEFDKQFMLCDIRHLQKINHWDETQISGLEIFVNDFDDIAEISSEIYDQIPYDLSTETVQKRYPQIFDWLQLQDMNVIVILILIILVATVSMISTLLVLILERTQMIGILKSLGARNTSIRRIFLTQAAYIIVFGLFFGNLLGIGLAYLQKSFGLIKLDPDTYYMAVVPINLDLFPILLLNIATLILVLVFMLIPVLVISRIQPVQAIRFD